jgi:cytochrome d ubiquinol oxidase subunit I
MQHPVGYVMNPEKGRAELTSIVEVLTQKTALATFAHTLTLAAFTSGAFMVGVSGWLLAKKRHEAVLKPTLKLGLVTVIISFLLVGISGDWSARVMTEQQPMKMAAAEALYNTESGAPFSLLTIGTLDGSRSIFQIGIPKFLSFMSTGDFNGTVEGINDLQAKYEDQYGPGNYKPNIPMAYWGFRLMIGFGAIAFLFALVALYQLRKRGVPTGRWFVPAMVWMPFLPLLANSFGWIFTETARQPWTVFGLAKTADGVSPQVGVGALWTTLIGYVVLYGLLAAIEVKLMIRAIKLGPDEEISYTEPTEVGGSSDRPLAMSY